MSKLEAVQKNILELTPLEKKHLEIWFEEQLQILWDEQFEQDVQAGRLDALAAKAIKDFETRNYREL
jgi:hypothetical protein